jgi:hypothetical protein
MRMIETMDIEERFGKAGADSGSSVLNGLMNGFGKA